MFELITPAFMSVVFVLAAAGLVTWGVVAHRAMLKALHAFAARQGFEVVGSGKWLQTPRLTATRRGRRIELHTFTTGSGKSRTTWSALAITPATPTPLTFSLEKPGLLTKLNALFGAREITIGDAAFDARWFIRTNQPEFLRAALLPEVRVKLDAARESGATGVFKLEAGTVSYIERGAFSNERFARFERVLELTGDLADIAEVAA